MATARTIAGDSINPGAAVQRSNEFVEGEELGLEPMASDPPSPPPAPPPLPRPSTPREESVVPAGGVIYKVDSSRGSFGELWRDSRSPTVLIGWVSKLLRARLPGSVNDPNVESLRPFEVDPDDLSADVREQFGPKLQEFASLGFMPAHAVAHRIVDLFNNSQTHMVSLPRSDGRAVARVVLRTEGSSVPPRAHFYCDIVSERPDGSFLWTTGASAWLNAPEGVVVQQQVQATPNALWNRHQDALKATAAPQAASGGAQVREAARDLLDRHHYRIRDYHLQRRLFVPLTPAEAEDAKEIERSYAHAATAGFSFPEVYAEMKRLQRPGSNWVSGVIILILSLVLFIAIGIPGLDGGDPAQPPGGPGTSGSVWQTLAIIVGLLFFHELGHYLAMRVFGYRNVRMFFIPMLGAAVSGQSYGAPGWKKIVVALMGPLPGIVAGAVVGIAGVWYEQPLLVTIALLSLALNGFNLLPLLPLDGGRVAQSILFSRHYGLDIAFRIAAGLLLILGGLFLPGGRLIMLLGVMMLIAVPAALRIGQIAAALRKQGFGPSRGASPATATDEPPPELARVIIERVDQTFGKSKFWSKARSNKLLAQHAMGVYESLATRSPGWMASIGFGLLHASGFLFALLMAVGLMVASRSDWLAFAQAAAAQPRWEIASSQIESTSGEAAPTLLTLMANFDSPADARVAYAALESEPTAAERLTRFGQTLMVSLGEDVTDERREGWFSLLESHSTDVFASSPQTGGSLRLMFLAPDEQAAQDLEEELSSYFTMPMQFHLVPPWHSGEGLEGSIDRETQQRARRTYQALNSAGADAFADPRVEQLDKASATAARRGDTAAIERLAEQRQVLYAQIQQEAMDKLIASDDGTMDPYIIERYLEIREQEANAPPATAPSTLPSGEGVEDLFDEDLYYAPTPMYDYESEAYRDMAQRMGALPRDEDGRLLPGADRFSGYGGVYRTGLLVSLEWVQLNDPATGGPALVEWLEAHDAQALKYEVVGPMDFWEE